MTYRIQHARALDAHQLDILWKDGLKGTIDFGRFIREMPIYAPLRDPEIFRNVQLYDYGHSIYWMGPDGSEIDICPDVLRAEVDPDAAAFVKAMQADFHRQSAAE